MPARAQKMHIPLSMLAHRMVRCHVLECMTRMQSMVNYNKFSVSLAERCTTKSCPKR